MLFFQKFSRGHRSTAALTMLQCQLLAVLRVSCLGFQGWVSLCLILRYQKADVMICISDIMHHVFLILSYLRQHMWFGAIYNSQKTLSIYRYASSIAQEMQSMGKGLRNMDFAEKAPVSSFFSLISTCEEMVPMSKDTKIICVTSSRKTVNYAWPR